MFTRNWPDIHVAALKQRFADGLSFAQIAADINATFGTSYSRNGCIGKARRIGLTLADKPRQNITPAARGATGRRPSRPTAPEVPPGTARAVGLGEGMEAAQPVIPRHLSICDLTAHTCRWPYGGWPESKPITFCGCEPLAGSSYCAAHFRLSIGPGTVSERAAHRGVST